MNQSSSKFFLTQQRQIKRWIEGVLNRKLPSDNLFTCLKDGLVLCELINELYPQHYIDCHHDIQDPQSCMNNVTSFLSALRHVGVKELFTVYDLCYKADMFSVLDCVAALAKKAHQQRLCDGLHRLTPSDADFSPNLIQTVYRELELQSERNQFFESRHQKHRQFLLEEQEEDSLRDSTHLQPFVSTPLEIDSVQPWEGIQLEGTTSVAVIPSRLRGGRPRASSCMLSSAAAASRPASVQEIPARDVARARSGSRMVTPDASYDNAKEAFKLLKRFTTSGDMVFPCMVLHQGRLLTHLHLNTKRFTLRQYSVNHSRDRQACKLQDLHRFIPVVKGPQAGLKNRLVLEFDNQTTEAARKWDLEFLTLEERDLFLHCLRIVLANDPSRPKSTPPFSIPVFIGTWNVADSQPPDDLTAWIPPNDYQIYVIGAQECMYKQLNSEEDWFNRITKHLGDDYFTVDKLSLYKMRLIVLAHRGLEHAIHSVEIASKATGIANVIGNKGGIACAFSCYGTRLCFLSCHLAAHQSRTDVRNQNIYDIFETLRLGREEIDMNLQFHYMFLFGDLNYRIDLKREEVIELAEARKFTQLYKNDQLRAERNAGTVLVDFSEARFKYPPTYKYEVGNRVYATEKNRVPSYCDRILWKTMPGAELRFMMQRDTPEITTSDHSPICAGFEFSPIVPNLMALPTHSFERVNTDLLPQHIPNSRWCWLELFQVRATNLRVGSVTSTSEATSSNLLNPYIIFSGSFLEEPIHSGVRPNTLNPVWTRNDVPELRSFIANPQDMMTRHLYVTLMDSGGIKADRRIGQGLISLRSACQRDPVPFTIPLLQYGMMVGKFTGMIRVVFKE